MPLVRGHHSFDDHFTQIPNQWLRDSKLSLKSIGLLAQIMSHTPGWNMSIRSLARANGTGVDTIKSAVLELEHCGYLKRGERQKQNEDGTFADYEWVTCDPFQNPVTAQPHHGQTEHKEEQDSLEEQEIKNNERTSERELFDSFYKEYPRKVSPGDAFKAFKSALKRAKFEDIIAGLLQYKASGLPDKQFIPYPATWLRGDSWESEFSPSPDSEAAERARIRREKEIAASKAFLDQQREAEAQAGPPPLCQHGVLIARCNECMRSLE